eukprot:UN24896
MGKGILKWIGDINRETMFGIQMTTGSGNCDGMMGGVRYFKVPSGTGKFIYAEDVTHVYRRNASGKREKLRFSAEFYSSSPQGGDHLGEGGLGFDGGPGGRGPAMSVQIESKPRFQDEQIRIAMGQALGGSSAPGSSVPGGSNHNNNPGGYNNNNHGNYNQGNHGGYNSSVPGGSQPGGAPGQGAPQPKPKNNKLRLKDNNRKARTASGMQVDILSTAVDGGEEVALVKDKQGQMLLRSMDSLSTDGKPFTKDMYKRKEKKRLLKETSVSILQQILSSIQSDEDRQAVLEQFLKQNKNGIL